MKKTMALILAVLFVATSFSGCGTPPNFGFTIEEFGQMLQQRIDETDYRSTLQVDWKLSTSEKFGTSWHGNAGSDIAFVIDCANGETGPVTSISLQQDYRKHEHWTLKVSHVTEEFRFLVEQVYEICNPQCTEEEKKAFKDAIFVAMSRVPDEIGTKHDENDIRYAFRDNEKFDYISFSVDFK